MLIKPSARKILAKRIETKAILNMKGNRIGIQLLKDLKKTNLIYALNEVFMPTLIMHGAQDKTIPVEQLDIAREHMRSKRIEITTFHDGKEGLQQLNHRKALFHHVMEFIEKYA